MRGEIGGTAANDAAHRANPCRNPRAIRERADADGDVDMILDEGEIAVGEDKPDIDFRPLAKKLGNDRQDVQPAKDHGRGDDEVASWRGMFPRRRALGLAHLFEDALCRGEIGRARIGQREFAGRPGQEPCIQMRFEIGNLATDRRQRNAELTAGGGQAAGLRNRHQERHGFKAVHIPANERVLSDDARLLNEMEYATCAGQAHSGRTSRGISPWLTDFLISPQRPACAPRRKPMAAANIGRTSTATAPLIASPRPRRRSSPNATAFTWRPSLRAAGPMSSTAAARPASSAFSTTRRWRFPTFAATASISAPAISPQTTARR